MDGYACDDSWRCLCANIIVLHEFSISPRILSLQCCTPSLVASLIVANIHMIATVAENRFICKRMTNETVFNILVNVCMTVSLTPSVSRSHDWNVNVANSWKDFGYNIFRSLDEWRILYAKQLTRRSCGSRQIHHCFGFFPSHQYISTQSVWNLLYHPCAMPMHNVKRRYPHAV